MLKKFIKLTRFLIDLSLLFFISLIVNVLVNYYPEVFLKF